VQNQVFWISSCTVLSGSDLSENGESVSGDEEFAGAVASAPAETQKVVDYLEFLHKRDNRKVFLILNTSGL
jgi:hypothetical protein